jgi:3-hydroxyisobutyrate dehydrogenase
MSAETIGFIGLGAMGGPIAANLAAGGVDLIVYDAAGAEGRAPAGARIARSTAEVATNADAIFLSLPDGEVVASVAREIIETNDRRVTTVVDTSTIGIAAAQSVHQALADATLDFVDAPVSGGVAGARAATISLMFSGREETLERLRPVFDKMSANVFLIGTEPGQGQAMKIANNFLSGTAMAATCEAVAFGTSQGLDMQLMLDVLNVSSGQNTASRDKFPQQVVTEKFTAGFRNTQMRKDCRLYLESVNAAGTASEIGSLVTSMWDRHSEAEPDADITMMYKFLQGRR